MIYSWTNETTVEIIIKIIQHQSPKMWWGHKLSDLYISTPRIRELSSRSWYVICFFFFYLSSTRARSERALRKANEQEEKINKNGDCMKEIERLFLFSSSAASQHSTEPIFHTYSLLSPLLLLCCLQRREWVVT